MPAETRKRTRAKMEEDSPVNPEEALKEAEARVKKARSEAKDSKADSSIADLTSMFGKMGGRKRKTRRSTKRRKTRVRKH